MSGSKASQKAFETAVKHRTRRKVNQHLVHNHFGIMSHYLRRKVNIDIFHPAAFTSSIPVLLLNDGQDAKLLHLEDILSRRYAHAGQTNIFVIGIHAGDRIREYGTSGIPDYKGRGNKAIDHLSFVLKELLPIIREEFDVARMPGLTYAGFSLGGLSALDSVWQHPEVFSKAGVFSGSLWWRAKEFNDQYHDTDRIMHTRIEAGPYKPGLSFWFEAGTNDETADRNNNGIIDAIDDTLDLITSLKSVGYNDDQITYVEVQGGEHNFHTWSEVFPEFLEWAFDSVKNK